MEDPSLILCSAIRNLSKTAEFVIRGNDDDLINNIEWKTIDHPSIKDIHNEFERIKNTKPIVAMRTERNKLLAQSDWVLMEDSKVSESKKVEWRKYRQQLRDFPLYALSLDGISEDIVWPLPPSQ